MKNKGYKNRCGCGVPLGSRHRGRSRDAYQSVLVRERGELADLKELSFFGDDKEWGQCVAEEVSRLARWFWRLFRSAT